MRLALFDLDNTLLAGDSDHLWGEYMIHAGLVDAQVYKRENDRFYGDYKAGKLDIAAYTRFALEPLVRLGTQALLPLRERFIAEVIEPIVAPAAPALLERHRIQGDELVIITATNRFVTEPIAALLGIEHLLATDPEVLAGRYTGAITGVPCYKDGKVERLALWRAAQADRYEHVTFYSDSLNDLPLLRQVDQPVAVDPDDTLRAEAQRLGWPIITLREPLAAL
ncbi:MAG TPA: HAD family hydrolase [Verrucomicrobiae bacterium]|nr:HAD family hydrolase [Verrucomicrobiae bacterium]